MTDARKERVILSGAWRAEGSVLPKNVPKRTDSSTSPPIGGFVQNDIYFTVCKAEQQFTVFYDTEVPVCR